MEIYNMNSLDSGTRATCPLCFGPLKQIVEGETGERAEWIVCAGICGKWFCPPWPENQWEAPESRIIPEELRLERAPKLICSVAA